MINNKHGAISLEKSKILIVDGEPGHMQMMKNILQEDSDYNLIVISKGDLACEFAEKEIPDIIIVDLDKPPSEGLETIKSMRLNNTTKDIPIIITTDVKMSLRGLKAAFEAGATEYLRNPVEDVELMARVRAMLTLSSKNKKAKQLEKELEKQTIELNERNGELDSFSHTIGHDLKTPLNNMMCYLTILKEGWGNLSEKSNIDYLNGLIGMIIDMAQIIDELMLLSSVRRIDDLQIEEIDSEKIINKVLTHNGFILKEKGAEVVLQEKIHNSLGYSVWIEEVWNNLISNAIKFGGSPLKIEIGSELKENSVCYWIKDNGPGIDNEDQKIIFDQFTRVHNNVASGHGLGLSIVSRIIKKLGGDVGVESTLSKGAKFYFTLPLT